MAEPDVVPARPLIAVFVTGIVLGIVTITLLETLYYWGTRDEFAAKNVEPPRELTGIREAAEQRLSGYRLVDGEKQRYAIPIERAMDAVVAEEAPAR